MGRKAPRKRLACRVKCRPTGASQAPVRLSALRHPSIGGAKRKFQNPGAKNAPREREAVAEAMAGLLARRSLGEGGKELFEK
jgi:hypothetical protein